MRSTAAERLVTRNPADNGTPAPAPANAGKAKPRPTRQRRPRQAAVDVEDVIRGAVEKVQAQGEAEAERLKAAIRKAIGVLDAAIP